GPVRAELTVVRARLAVEAGRALDAAELLLEGAQADVDDLTRLSLLCMAGFYALTGAAPPGQLDLVRRVAELTPDGDGWTGAVLLLNLNVRMCVEGGTWLSRALVRAEGRVSFAVRFILAKQAVITADREGMIDAAADLERECRAEGRRRRVPKAMTL